MLKLYRTTAGVVLERDGEFLALSQQWDALLGHADLHGYLGGARAGAAGPAGVQRVDGLAGAPLPPVGAQEVWAAGAVDQKRPELYFKTAGWRVRGPGESIRVRRDAARSVPEPELAACVNARGDIVGYTIGNDVTAIDIADGNPPFKPQAKVYDGACALGPALLVTPAPLPADTEITLRVERNGRTAFAETATLALRRSPADLVAWLYRELSFPVGSVLLTGVTIVPPDDLSLQRGDAVSITVPSIGTLANPVA